MRRTVLAAGSVIAALLTGGVLAVSGGAQATSGRTIALVTKDFHVKTTDVPPRGLERGSFGSGDNFLSSGRVFSPAGARRGAFDARCTITRGGSIARLLCDGVYALKEGHIFIQMRFSFTSLSDMPKPTQGAVVGGTRAYAGARGTFTTGELTEEDEDDSGDGSEDIITLLP